MCVLYAPFAPAQPILMEAPLVLQAPGFRGVWPSWYDGERFWVEPHPLMELLGYEIMVSDSMALSIRDSRHSIRFDYTANRIEVNGEAVVEGAFAMRGGEGMLSTLEALQEAFGADMVWDESALTLTLSASAQLFDPTQFGSRTLADTERLENVLYPRQRSWVGGVHVGYTLAHRSRAMEGRSLSYDGRVTADIAGGTARWVMSQGGAVFGYTLDIPRRWITRITARHSGAGGLGMQLSNRPLSPRTIHRDATLSGVTVPHAIVRGKVFDSVTEQVQADHEGRFTIRHPVFYGTTEATVEVEPLGGEPVSLIEVDRLTPYELLPPGDVEYDLTVSQSPAGQVAWGVSRALTLLASATHTPRTATLRATLLPLPTMHTSAEVDVLSLSGAAHLRWWRTWGGVNADIHIQQSPVLTQHWSTSATVAGRRQSLYVRALHRRTENVPPQTLLTSTLIWRWGQTLSLRGGVTFQSWSEPPVSFSPGVTYTFPLAKPRLHLRISGASAGREVESFRVGTYMTGRAWSLGLEGLRSVEDAETELRGSFQLNTEWAWFDARAGRGADGFEHSQTLRGAVMVGEDIRFGALYEERTQAVIRLFRDTNLNGVLDATEPLNLRHQLNVSHLTVHHRPNGEVVVPNLTPHDTYTVTLLSSSIPDPLLYPATGYRFAFVATPGKTRYIDIPLQRLPTLSGQLTGWSGSYTVLQVHAARISSPNELSEQPPHILDVYQDGVFLAQLPPGSYRITVINLLTDERVNESILDVGVGENTPTIALQP